MTRKNPERPKRTIREIVEYNASMIHEVYESVMKLRKLVAIYTPVFASAVAVRPDAGKDGRGEIMKLNFQCPDRVIEELDKFIDGTQFQSRAQLIRCILADWIQSELGRDDLVQELEELEGGGDKDPDPVATPPSWWREDRRR